MLGVGGSEFDSAAEQCINISLSLSKCNKIPLTAHLKLLRISLESQSSFFISKGHHQDVQTEMPLASGRDLQLIRAMKKLNSTLKCVSKKFSNLTGLSDFHEPGNNLKSI